MDYLKNYIEVKDRIQMFYDKFPEGTLHFQYKGVLEFNGETYIYGEALLTLNATKWLMQVVGLGNVYQLEALLKVLR